MAGRVSERLALIIALKVGVYEDNNVAYVETSLGVSGSVDNLPPSIYSV
jgi:hypothetical protein